MAKTAKSLFHTLPHCFLRSQLFKPNCRNLSSHVKYSIEVNNQKDFLRVSLKSRVLNLSFEYLLDNNVHSFDPISSQRMENIVDVNQNVDLIDWRLNDDNKLELFWGDKRTTFFDLSLLEESAKHKQVFWDSSSFNKLIWSRAIDVNGLNGSECEKIMDQFYGLFARYGVVFVKNVEANESATKKLCEKMGIISRTYYGADMWTVAADGKHADTFATNLAIRTHTDNTYFDAPLGVQVFHCLSHDGSGGETLLVDGFNISKLLRQKDQESYNTLTRVPIRYRYLDPGKAMFKASGPMITEECEGFLSLKQFRYNDYDRDIDQSHLSLEDQRAFFKALQKAAILIQSPENEVTLKLSPGLVVFIDNWRVLHGRNSFTGNRVLCGCYMERHDWRSKAALAQF